MINKATVVTNIDFDWVSYVLNAKLVYVFSEDDICIPIPIPESNVNAFKRAGVVKVMGEIEKLLRSGYTNKEEVLNLKSKLGNLLSDRIIKANHLPSLESVMCDVKSLIIQSRK